MRAAAAILFLVGGCNAILGIGDVKSSAGGPDAPVVQPDAPILACPAASNSNVVGCWFDEFISSDVQSTTAAHDLSHFTIQAWVPDNTAAGFHSEPSTVIAPGVFTIDMVPAGVTYYLEVLDTSTPGAIPTYYATAQRALDLSVVAVGRPGTSPVTKQTTVTLNIDKMTAWLSPDYLLLDSFSVDTENFVGYPAAPSNPPTDGATSIGLTLNWQNSYGFVFPPMLLDLAHHDDLWVTHNTSITLSDQANHPYTGQVVADAFTSTDVDMKDGQPLTLNGSFSQVTPTATQDFTVNLADLRTALSDANHYFDENVGCGLLVNPASTYGNGIGPTIGGFTVDTNTNEAALLGQATLATLHYGNPYPASWPVVMPCSVQHTRLFRAPGATKIGALTASITVWDSGQTPYLFHSQGHAPTGITIGGQPLLDGGAVAFDGTAPVMVTWNAVPMTDSYIVDVYEVALDVTKTTITHLAIFRTGATSLALPGSLFTKGHYYLFAVGETRQTAAYSTGQLNRSSTPHSGGGVISGIFRFSNDCGNGTVDAGEDCDTKGATATCDADCTAIKCGDGTVNTAAGEQCDDVLDSPHCNAGTCKTSVCGDNYWNQAAGEECDDGNIVNGDGCNSQCKLEHCGNGTLDNFEDCDDGNNTNGDGCNAFCRVEQGWSCDTSSPTKCTPM
jgi:cysteine-rich repeat protein